MKTIKLYETDGMLSSFRANVIQTKETEKGYAIMLDQTAFFPEGGGQGGDSGYIGEYAVLDTHEKGGEIWHYVDSPIAVGEKYGIEVN